MLTHICDHMHILALQIAPILHSKAPYHALTSLEFVFTFFVSKLVKDVTILVFWVQKWATSTFCVLSVVMIVANVDLVVLK